MEKVVVSTKAEWRNWLERNHGSVREVWLVFWKKNTGRECVEYEDAVRQALCFGWIDGLIRKIDEDSYARRFGPRQPASPWSPLNRERALDLIRTGEMTASGMEAVRAARESGAWYAPASTIEMPDELENELDLNPQAALFFSELAPSYRKHYMGWVGSARRPETRRKRAREACELLSKGMKLPMK